MERLVALLIGVVILLLIAIISISGFIMYFLPSIIGKDKKDATGIFLVNLFFGWSFIAWIITLVWAITNDYKKKPKKDNTGLIVGITVGGFVILVISIISLVFLFVSGTVFLALNA